jgi:mycofactocin biosynthesis protein MftB
VSTNFDLDRRWRLDDRVAMRPESFGALLYHFGTRRLSFIKDRKLMAVVQALAGQPSARAACAQAGLAEVELAACVRALAALAAAQMISERPVPELPIPERAVSERTVA